ncbi:TPA: Maff2 family mobile element protein [Streptococcus agalactiae]
MDFFVQAVNVLKILVMAVGAGLGAWGVINLMEGYGNDNPGAKSQGIKQLMAGGGIVLIGLKLIPSEVSKQILSQCLSTLMIKSEQ